MTTARLQPHSALSYYRPDEIAECWDGVIAVPGLYEALWDILPEEASYADNIEDIGPADVIGLDSVVERWSDLSREHQEALNRLAVANTRQWEV